ncbi:MAG TPA: hypothetical protein VFZ61_00755 [Polyangiales bacterium]
MDKQAHDAWHVREHGPIEKLADNLWRVQGSLPGMSLRRTMTAVRKRSGELVIHSGIVLENGALRELEAWGTPTYLLIPNRGHTLDAAAYKKRYPAIKIFTPRGGVTQVETKIHAKVDGAYEDFPGDDEVKLSTLHGVEEGEGVMLVRSGDGLTVVLNDAVMNMDRKRDPLGFIFTTLMGSAPGPRVSRFAKLMFIKDQAALRRDLLEFAALPDVVRLIVAHEKVAQGPEARRALERAATFLHA